MNQPKRKRFRIKLNLFWRIYLYGVLLLVGVLLAGASVARLVNQSPPDHFAPERLARYINEHLDEPGFSDKELPSLLHHLHAITGATLGVYDGSGVVAAKGGGIPQKPLAGEALERIDHKDVSYWGEAFHMSFPIDEARPARGLLVISWEAGRHHLALAAALLAILIVLAVMPFVLARSLSKPMGAIAEAATAFGGGDLQARTGVSRKDELGRLAQAVDAMADRIERSIIAEKELLANISHEIRTPISRLNVALELIEESEGLAPGVRKKVLDMGRDIADLDRLLEDVFLVTRLDVTNERARPYALRRTSLSADEPIREALEAFRLSHPERTVETEITEPIPKLSGDPIYLKRLFANLLDNAAKYSPETSPITLAAWSEANRFIVEVQDRGPGVPADKTERIFEPFYRADASRDKKTDGVGLGLALCRRIAKAHGGDISLRSPEGGGAVFRVTLPTS